MGEKEQREERNMSPAIPENVSRWRWVDEEEGQGWGGGGVLRMEVRVG